MNHASPATLPAAILGRCPRCGQGSLFDGYLTVAKACRVCHLDYAMFDPGDGPAVFGILIIGFLVAGGALYVEVAYSPPYWVHAVIWLPLIVILTFSVLRFLKGLLLVLQYKNQAREGRLEE